MSLIKICVAFAAALFMVATPSAYAKKAKTVTPVAAVTVNRIDTPSKILAVKNLSSSLGGKCLDYGAAGKACYHGDRSYIYEKDGKIVDKGFWTTPASASDKLSMAPIACVTFTTNASPVTDVRCDLIDLANSRSQKVYASWEDIAPTYPFTVLIQGASN